ncbi:hypothetical protein [Streptomyces coerulescens]|uniref:Uncharacterized protein n=1 Tax=Streptomyces coerulescens TaxID=29304 RepID=A0ABW0CW52_STRCD
MAEPDRKSSVPTWSLELPGLTTAIEDLAPAVARTDLTFGLVPAGDELRGFVDLLRAEVDRALRS